MLSYRPGTANDFQCGLNQFSNIENRILTHRLFEKKKQQMNAYTLHLQATKNMNKMMET